VRERNNYQYVVVEVLDGGPVVRDRLIVALEAEGVMARRYFWPGCHAAQPYVANVRTSAALEQTTKVAGRVIVLPTGSAVSPEAAGTIARTLKVALAEARSGRCA
jgi:dTDP-4-amino-4,6-dideoxygalactose transaminase